MNIKSSRNRRLCLETLEPRLALSGSPTTIEPFVDQIDPSTLSQQLSSQEVIAAREQTQSFLLNSSIAEPRAFVTTTGPSANYVTPTGTSLDGVVDIFVSFPSGSLARGTGTLLPTGQHVLTAAHIFFESGTGVFASGATVFVNAPSGTSSFGSFVPQINQSYTGATTSPGDIAVLRINGNAPDGVSRFDIYRDTDEVGNQFDKVGYGLSGTGAQGSVLASGVKRNGENRFDALGESLNGTVYVPGTITSGTHLVFDFDNGIAANDASGVFLGISDLGLGNAEVSTAQGDSGGPAFIDGRIAGVTSFGQGFTGLPDVLAGTNSSFGEFAVDTRVSTYATFIDALIDEAGLPTITDVTLVSSGASTSLSDRTGTGDQFVPISTQAGTDTIEITFSEHVLLDGSELILTGKTGLINDIDYSYDVGSHTASWDFNNLANDKYVLFVDDTVVDVGGNALDGDWANDASGTFDVTSDDPNTPFANIGNGMAGGDFFFAFAIENAGGAALPALKTDGDATHDDLTDNADYSYWRAAYQTVINGGSKDLQADFNDNGSVDLADYTVWVGHLGASSAWHDLPTAGSSASGTGIGVPLIQFGLAPTVTNVTISGSNSTHAPFDMDQVDGSGTQLLTVPVGGADSVSVKFSEDVNITAGDLRLRGLTTAALPDVAEFTYDMFTQTATWRFDSIAANDMYAISLIDSVTDIEGNLLDGEWTNPASIFTINSSVTEFPSGDGTMGGNFNFVFTLLAGDSNIDNSVSGLDLAIFSANFGDPNLIALFTDGDFNGDSTVSGLDLSYLGANWGLQLQNLSILSDLNGDGVVDTADSDFLIVKMLADIQNPTQADGDLDADGDIDSDDLDLVFAQLGLELDLVA